MTSAYFLQCSRRRLGHNAMQAAARRFFSAFYHWNQANDEALCQGSSRAPAINLKQRTRAHYACKLRPPSSSPASLKNPYPHHPVRSFSTTKPYRQLTAPPITTLEPPPLSTHIRTLMRKIPHPVVVITSSSPQTIGDPSTSIDRGMTVSSLTTVTLHPSPVFSFNIRRPSSTLSALTSSRQFLVHFLRATARGARIADAFTKGDAGEAFRSLVGEGVHVLKRRGEKGGPPILACKDVMRVVRCEMMGMGVEVEDHVIILGKVLGVLKDSMSEEEQADPKDLGLVYVNKGYRSASDGISLESEVNRDGRATSP